ncbi:MAG: PhzF family phenazine biosynthesis protein, partial [[Eubacterium] sulci]|nr:PhzF family phenazine biosynthesis protein [[Eubacterium] sulci]
ALQPDMFLLSKVSEEYKVTGVHAFTLDSEDGVTAHCRNFAPLYDIDEEAATGTASGALTYYLYLNRCIGANDSCHLVQGEAMGRPSAILTEINADSKSDGSVDCKIKVGGKAALLASGEIML